MIAKGQKIWIAFDLTVEGRLVQSVAVWRPLSYVQGQRAGNGIPRAFENAVRTMAVGQRKTFVLRPREGFGGVKPVLLMEMPKARFALKYHMAGKEILSGNGKFLARVKEVRGDKLLVDFNHPYAGKDLKYDVVLVGVGAQRMRPTGKY